MFQSTRPCGARLAHEGVTYTKGGFQSTRPCGARPRIAPPGWRTPASFNPRAPAGRDAHRARSRTLPVLFQSTRPCGARPNNMLASIFCADVSIHAPLRGATHGIELHYQSAPVSIHAPLRGATHVFDRGVGEKLFQSTRPCGARPRPCISISACARFNPRAPAGRDLAPARWPLSQPVSIHAPLRGATTLPCAVIPDLASFNPRAPAGRD